MKNMSKTLLPSLLLSGLVLGTASMSQAGFDKTVKKKIARLDLKAKLELVDSDNLGLKYNYQVHPSFIDDWYTRVDEIVLDTGVDLNQVVDIDFGTRVVTGSTVTVVRQFKNHGEAVMASPKVVLLNKLPSTAKRALENMETGDFVSFTTQLNLLISKGLAHEQGIVRTSIGASYLLAGEFDIRIYRLKGQKIRMQLVGVRKRHKSGGASIDILSGFDVFNMDLLNKAVEKKLNFNLARVSAKIEDNDLFMVDYNIDLSDENASKAYDSVLSATKDVTHLKKARLSILNPLKSLKNIKADLAENIVALEKLRQQNSSAVVRVFHADNEATSKNVSYGLGLNLIRLRASINVGENNFSLKGPDGSKKHYYMPTRIDTAGWKLLMGYWSENSQMQANMLYSQNANGKERTFISRGFEHVYLDKLYDVGEQEDFRKVVNVVLPKEIRKQIKWGQWDITKSENQVNRKNVRLDSNIQISRGALESIVKMNLKQESFEIKLSSFIQRLREENVGLIEQKNPVASRFDSPVCKTPKLRRSAYQYYTTDTNEDFHLEKGASYANTICLLAQSLEKVFNPDLKKNQRVELFQNLTDSNFFREVGMPFLINLLPKETLQQNVNVRLSWSSANTEPLVFSYGNADQSVYNSVLAMQNVLLQRSYDIRIITDAVRD